MGQFTDFISHDGKPSALFASSGRLDGRIQGQQIGLFGNAPDFGDGVADFMAVFGEGFDAAGGIAYHIGKLADAVGALSDTGAAVASGGYPTDAAVSLGRLEAEAEQLWRWIDALLGLQPVSYISPTALTDLARLLGRAGQKSDARKWAARVVAAAPAHSEVYAAAASVELGAS